MAKVIGRLSRILGVALVASGALGCAAVSEGEVFDSTFWAGNLFAEYRSQEQTKLGLAEMTQGNYGRAERHFDTALRANPRNVHALLGRGVLFQNTGQVLKAREMYEAILAIRPEQSKQMVVWTNFAPKPISEIASVNLALLESGGVPASMERGAAGRQEPAQASSGISSAPSASALTARTPPPPPGLGPGIRGHAGVINDQVRRRRRQHRVPLQDHDRAARPGADHRGGISDAPPSQRWRSGAVDLAASSGRARPAVPHHRAGGGTAQGHRPRPRDARHDDLPARLGALDDP